MQTYDTTPIAYFVRSSGNPTVFYRLMTDSDGALACECKAAVYSRKPCRHVRAVIAGECLAAQPVRRPASRSLTVAPISPETRDRLAALEV